MDIIAEDTNVFKLSCTRSGKRFKPATQELWTQRRASVAAEWPCRQRAQPDTRLAARVATGGAGTMPGVHGSQYHGQQDLLQQHGALEAAGSLATLPDSVLVHVAANLDLTDWLSAASTCRAWRMPLLHAVPCGVRIEQHVSWLAPSRDAAGECVAATELQQKLVKAGQAFQPDRLVLDFGEDMEPRWPRSVGKMMGGCNAASAKQQAVAIMQGM